MTITTITQSTGPAIEQLCHLLRETIDSRETPEAWPKDSLQRCADGGVFRWFLPTDAGGFGWTDPEQTRGYLRLAAADLNTTFIITQRMGACRRIADSSNPLPANRWMNSLLSGECSATVGISHLTTSRRHLKQPALSAIADRSGYRLTGYSPWVTGGCHADLLVVGATLEDQQQMLVVVPRDQPGIVAGSGASLVALSASCTDRVDFDDVWVPPENVLAGPSDDVMGQGGGAATGGLQTSTLAAGLAQAAAAFVQAEAAQRKDLTEIAANLTRETTELELDLMAAATGTAHCDTAALRGRANRLVLRSTQAALTAAKGAGFVSGHPAGRWCREALFFLVWSCPQPVAQAHLCELAGIS